MAQLKHKFPEVKTATQTHTIEIEKLKEIESVTADGGNVEVVSIDDNLVTLQFKDRTWDRRVQTGGSYTPGDSKYVTAQTSSYYNSGGYTGTLTRYLYSGSYTPEDSKNVTGHSSSYYDVGGYTGTLTRYLYSGELIKGESAGYKEITKDWYRNEETGEWSPSGPVLPESMYYRSGNISGTLHQIDRSQASNWQSGIYRGEVFYDDVDTRVYKYKGTVTKPASDTRVYKYKGTVTKPASDTRVYKYEGTVYKGSSDTRTYDYYYQYTATINYIERGFEIQTKVNGQLRIANEGWVKVDGQLRPIDRLYIKIDGIVKEVK